MTMREPNHSNPHNHRSSNQNSSQHTNNKKSNRDASDKKQNSSNTATGSLSVSQQMALLRHVIAHPQQMVVLTCYIPPNRVGAVIGRKGASIINIQREAAKRSHNHPGLVRVVVVNNETNNVHTGGVNNNNGTPSGNNPNCVGSSTNPTSDSSEGGTDVSNAPPTPPLWTPVIIRGDPCGAFAAASLLLPLIEYEMDDVVVEVPFHRHKHSAIIGRKGQTIAGLSADSNVRIMVPHKNSYQSEQQQQGGGESGEPSQTTSVNNSSNRREVSNVQLEGECSNVEQCLVKMLAVVAGPNSASVIGSGVVTNVENAPTNSKQQRNAKESGASTSHVQKNRNAQQQAMNEDETISTADGGTNEMGPTGKQKKSASSGGGNSIIEAVVTAPSNHLVPSLARLRQIGKRTSTIIRRKKVVVPNSLGDDISSNMAVDTMYEDRDEDLNDDADEGMSDNDEEDEDSSGNHKKQESSRGSHDNSQQHETQFIISGRQECVKSAVGLFNRLFSGESVDSIVDSVTSGTASNGFPGKKQQQGSTAGKGNFAGNTNRGNTNKTGKKNPKQQARSGGGGRGSDGSKNSNKTNNRGGGRGNNNKVVAAGSP